MDQQTKDELMNRWRERMAAATDPTLAGWQNPNDPIAQMFARWMIDFMADARELEREAMLDRLRAPAYVLDDQEERIEVTIAGAAVEPYDPAEAASRILDGLDDDTRADVIEQARKLSSDSG